MLRTVIEHVLLAMLLAVLAPLLMAQPPAAGSDSIVLSQSDGMVFRGTVLQIEHTQIPGGESPTVMVSFHVDESFRGCLAGETVVIREWTGLWLKGDRYRVGQQLLLRLYAPSDLGLTSTVANATGKTIVTPVDPIETKPALALSQTSPSSQRGTRPTDGESYSARARLRNLPAKPRESLPEAGE